MNEPHLPKERGLDAMESHPLQRMHFDQYQTWIYAPCKSPALNRSWPYIGLHEDVMFIECYLILLY